MDKTNSKILSLSFAITGALVGFVLHMLIITFAGVWGWVARMADGDVARHYLPVASGFAIFFALQFNRRVLEWGNDVVSELRKVVWPSRKDTTAMTIAVVVMVLLSSAIITVMDWMTGFVLKFVISS